MLRPFLQYCAVLATIRGVVCASVAVLRKWTGRRSKQEVGGYLELGVPGLDPRLVSPSLSSASFQILTYRLALTSDGSFPVLSASHLKEDTIPETRVLADDERRPGHWLGADGH